MFTKRIYFSRKAIQKIGEIGILGFLCSHSACALNSAPGLRQPSLGVPHTSLLEVGVSSSPGSFARQLSQVTSNNCVCTSSLSWSSIYDGYAWCFVSPSCLSARVDSSGRLFDYVACGCMAVGGDACYRYACSCNSMSGLCTCSNSNCYSASCALGSFVSGNDCYACSAGTYSSGGQNTACAFCPAGSVAPLWGSSSCTACNPGSYQPLSGRADCYSCPAGQTSRSGSTSCLAMSATSFCAHFNNDCTSCAAQSECFFCGQTSLSGLCAPSTMCNIALFAAIPSQCVVSVSQSPSLQQSNSQTLSPSPTPSQTPSSTSTLSQIIASTSTPSKTQSASKSVTYTDSGIQTFSSSPTKTQSPSQLVSPSPTNSMQIRLPSVSPSVFVKGSELTSPTYMPGLLSSFETSSTASAQASASSTYISTPKVLQTTADASQTPNPTNSPLISLPYTYTYSQLPFQSQNPALVSATPAAAPAIATPSSSFPTYGAICGIVVGACALVLAVSARCSTKRARAVNISSSGKHHDHHRKHTFLF